MIELFGLTGALLILVGFYEVTAGNWDGRSFRFEICNLLGAAIMFYYAFEKLAYMNLVLNTVWVGVALLGIVHTVQRHKLRRARKKSRKKRAS